MTMHCLPGILQKIFGSITPDFFFFPIRMRKQSDIKAEYVLRREEEEKSPKKSFNSQSLRLRGSPGPCKPLKRQISVKRGPFL